MKRTISTFVAVLAFMGAWAQQPSWKDSVGVKKVLDARYADGVVYFQVKKGWGVYDLQSKKVVVPAVYQFVKSMDARFYVVQNNKVGFISNEGRVIEQPMYSRLGQLVQVERRMEVKNDLLYHENEKEPLGNYTMLGEFTESSVAVHDGKVFVNQYVRLPRIPYQHVTPEGEAWDSVDAKGQLVYLQTEPDNISGIYNLADHTALPGFTEMSKVGFCKNNLLAKKHSRTGGTVLPTYYIQNASTGKIHTIKDENLVHTERKTISLVLGDYNTKFLYCMDSTCFTNQFIFESEGKYGVYDPYGMIVRVEPEYDFVYVPSRSDKVYTAKNGKVGLIELYSRKQLYDNSYESLEMHKMYDDNFGNMQVTECNRNAFELDQKLDKSLSLPPSDMIALRLRGLHDFSGLEMVNGKAVIHDYTAPYELQGTWDPDYPENEPAVTNHADECHGGVFDPAARKWIVKPQYSLISAATQGYACKGSCVLDNVYSCFTYAYFGPDGKTVFEKKSLDSLWKDETLLARLSHTGQAKNLQRIHNNLSWNTAIVTAANKYGIFDVDELKWKVEPVHEMIDHNKLSGYFTVVDSGRLGLLNYNYGQLVPSLYKKIDLLFQDNLLCANDTFLYSRDSMQLAGKVDTFKHTPFYYDQNLYGKLFLTIELDGKKIITSEELYDPETVLYSPEGEMITYITDSSGTHTTDLTTGARMHFAKGWNLREWDKGFLTADGNAVFHVYDASGKKVLSLSEKDSIGCSPQWLAYYDTDEQFAYDPKGDIVTTTGEDKLYLGKTYLPVGYDYHYFDGSKFIEGPKGFRALCVNRSGLMLGYEIQTDARTGKLVKHYRYYDTGTKQFSNVELELANSPVKVFAVKDGFVLMDHNRSERLYNCTVLENDLKTVKSTFKKLTGYKAARSYAGVNPIPYYELYTGKKIMYFDRGFQFLHECNYQDRLQYSLGYNRIFLKSKFKILVMDWKGRLIRQ